MQAITFVRESDSTNVSVPGDHTVLEGFRLSKIAIQMKKVPQRHIVFTTTDGVRIGHDMAIADLRNSSNGTIRVDVADRIFMRYLNRVIAINVKDCSLYQDAVVRALRKSKSVDWRYCHLLDSQSGVKTLLHEPIPDMSMYTGTGSTPDAPFDLVVRDSVWVRYCAQTSAVNLVDGIRYANLLSNALATFHVPTGDLRYCHLFDSGVKVSLVNVIPDLSMYTGTGSTHDSPFDLVVSDSVWVRYRGQTSAVNVNYCLRYADLFSKAILLFHVPTGDVRYCYLFDSDVQVSLGDEIPDMSIYTGTGSSVTSPLDLKVLDSIPILFEDSIIMVHVGGCASFADIVPLVKKDISALENFQYISFTDSEDRIVGLHEPIPSPLLVTLPYQVQPIVKNIFIVDQHGDDYREPKSVTILSDSHITTSYGGLSNIESDGANLEVVIHMKTLVDGRTYQPTSFKLSNFNAWQMVHSSAMEDEIGLTIKKALGPSRQLVQLPKVIRDSTGGRIAQQWDAVIYDRESNYLYIAEAKHKVTPSHFDEVKRKLENLPELLAESSHKRTATKAFDGIFPMTYKTVIASESFDESLKKRALKLGYLLCYPSGDRYLITNGPIN